MGKYRWISGYYQSLGFQVSWNQSVGIENVMYAFILPHTELTHSGVISTTPAKNAII